MDTNSNGVMTSYYVGGIGTVKEIEDILADSITILDELVNYSYQ